MCGTNSDRRHSSKAAHSPSGRKKVSTFVIFKNLMNPGQYAPTGRQEERPEDCLEHIKGIDLHTET
jgi:hypothetical protein